MNTFRLEGLKKIGIELFYLSQVCTATSISDLIPSSTDINTLKQHISFTSQ